ncbi:MAG: hypothetical protein QXT20_02660 [Candidatus Woesearchaeota archaeon]
MGRRGESLTFDFIIMIPVVMFITLVFLTYVFATSAFVKSRTQSSLAEAVIYANKFIFQKECLAYYSPAINRAYPGIVDITKFNQDRIEKCMNFPREEMAAAILNLTYNGMEHIVYYNEDRARIWNSLSRYEGGGSYLRYELRSPVLVYEGSGEKFLNGELTTIMLVPLR